MCAGDCLHLWWVALILLAIHVLFVTAMVLAPGILIVRKGGYDHRRWGKIYFWCWTGIAFLVLLLRIHEPFNGPSMMAVGVFYIAFTGRRSLYHKSSVEKATWLDWAGIAFAIAFGLALFFHGLTDFRLYLNRFEIVVGLLCLVLARFEIWDLLRPRDDPRSWLFKHMRNMLVSFVGGISIVVFVTMQFLPNYVYLSLPWLIGLPAVAGWMHYYRRKHGGESWIGMPARSPATNAIGDVGNAS